jgi:Putative Flp pilus-assembly TadE/G-like
MSGHAKHVSRRSFRRGGVLVYSLFTLLMMCALTSLAVDYGHVQVVKTELQRCADATARGALELYVTTGTKNTNTYLTTYIANYNPVDSASGVTPTVTSTWGYWKNNAFTAGTNSSYPTAIKVVLARSTPNGNAVPLTFPIPTPTGIVRKTCDVWAQAVAILPLPITINATVLSTSDPWLSGMSSGSASYDDTAPANSPTAINVIAGATLQFSSVSGTVQHYSGDSGSGPNGETSNMYWHMKDPPSGAQAQGSGAQNNIGDITVPIDALLGVFLANGAPTVANAPSSWLDFSTQAARDVTTYNSLQLQQPVLIGNGQSSTGTTKTFTVPPGATQLYMGQMDGYEWMNNLGQFTTTITEQPPIQIVE